MNWLSFQKKSMHVVLCCALVLGLAFGGGCSKGSSGTSAVTTGSVTGTVTSATGAVPLSGVSVSTTPSVGNPATTDSSGNYTLVLPAGSFTLTYTLANFTSATTTVSVSTGVTTQTNVTMAEAASGAPSVALTANQDVGYGQTFNVTASASSPVGGTLSYAWTGINGTSTTNAATATSVNMATAMGGVAAPSTDPGGYVTPYTQDNRFGILPINDDTRGQKTVKVTVSDGEGGSTSTSLVVYSAGVQGGVKAVALGVPVYLNSGVANDTTTTWSVLGPATSPTYSTSTAVGTGRNPSFTPDVVGQYVVTTGTGSTLTLYAGTYAGAISGGGYTSKTVYDANGMWYSWAPSSTQSSMTFTNWPTVTPDAGCKFCHNDVTAPDNFTPWAQTAHATFFARGLEGITPNNATCEKCHTVGYDQSAAAANGGFDDMAAATGFVYNKAVGSWASMWANNAGAARLSNIQCENCHGPQNNGGAHKTAGDGTSPSALRVSYSADVCGQCHSSGTSHHLYSEWSTTVPNILMSNGAAQNLAGMSHSKPVANHNGSYNCACHSAEGYAMYVDQLQAGDAYYSFGTTTNPDGSVKSYPINWDTTNVQPQTCTACHDPHDVSNPNQLRVYDAMPVIASGIKNINGLGKGAACVPCHNARNGLECASSPTATNYCTGGLSSTTYLHEDTESYNNGVPSGTLTTHDGPQTDVFMGRNAYFMGGTLPMLSKHAVIEDACVGCHMALNPQSHLSHGTPAVNSHAFYILDADRSTLCANCHGTTGAVNGDALVTSVQNQLANLATAMSNYIMTRINANLGAVYYNAGTSASPNYVAFTTVTSVSTTNGSSFTITDSNGAHAKMSATNIYSNNTGTTLFFLVQGGADPNKLPKAAWNYSLVNNDDSFGIHNPTFVTTVLNNTIAQMNDTSN